MRLALTTLIGLVATFGIAQSEEIGDRPFFKKIAGEWIGKGDLTNSDGEVTPIIEEWTGAKKEDGSFAMEGTRQMGDDTQEFRWHFLFNATSELIECEYWHTGMENSLFFEVQLSDEKVDLKAPFGDSGGELTISNTLEDGKINGAVLLSNSSGEETVTGKVLHEKRE